MGTKKASTFISTVLTSPKENGILSPFLPHLKKMMSHCTSGKPSPFASSPLPFTYHSMMLIVYNVVSNWHIVRILEDGSWTQKLADYLTLMIPPNTAFHSFKTAISKGRVIGPDGNKILRVYGPHSAPTQHISEYSVDMICGAGIGVTPLCATLKR